MLDLETRSHLEMGSRPVSEVLVLKVQVLVLVLNSDVLVSVLRKKGLKNFQDHMFSNVTNSKLEDLAGLKFVQKSTI